MKPQIIIPVSLLMLTFIFFANPLNAAGKSYKKIKTEQAGFNSKDINGLMDLLNNGSKNPPPSKPHKENEKDGPFKESGYKKAHSEEDGKHHHFHMHRAKKVRRCARLVCVLAKILLLIMHICLLAYAYYSTLAHVAH